MDLEDIIVKLEDIIGSNQSEEVGLAHLLTLPTLPRSRKDKATQQTSSGLFQFTCGNIRPISGYSKIKSYGQKNYKKIKGAES